MRRLIFSRIRRARLLARASYRLPACRRSMVRPPVNDRLCSSTLQRIEPVKSGEAQESGLAASCVGPSPLHQPVAGALRRGFDADAPSPARFNARSPPQLHAPCPVLSSSLRFNA